jgi:hypothetical protein
VRETGRDFGYDVSMWHQSLISSQASDDNRSEYTWSDLHKRFESWKPNADWQLAVDEAERLVLENPNCPHCGSFASLRKVAHGLPNANEVMWLCDVCKQRMLFEKMVVSI